MEKKNGKREFHHAYSGTLKLLLKSNSKPLPEDGIVHSQDNSARTRDANISFIGVVDEKNVTRNQRTIKKMNNNSFNF